MRHGCLAWYLTLILSVECYVMLEWICISPFCSSSRAKHKGILISWSAEWTQTMQYTLLVSGKFGIGESIGHSISHHTHAHTAHCKSQATGLSANRHKSLVMKRQDIIARSWGSASAAHPNRGTHRARLTSSSFDSWRPRGNNENTVTRSDRC